MPASEPSKRRTVPVKLADIPLEQRLKAAREEGRHAKTGEERLQLLIAAHAPSETVYWIHEAA